MQPAGVAVSAIVDGYVSSARAVLCIVGSLKVAGRQHAQIQRPHHVGPWLIGRWSSDTISPGDQSLLSVDDGDTYVSRMRAVLRIASIAADLRFGAVRVKGRACSIACDAGGALDAHKSRGTDRDMAQAMGELIELVTTGKRPATDDLGADLGTYRTNSGEGPADDLV